jgi:hypothetical protein
VKERSLHYLPEHVYMRPSMSLLIVLPFSHMFVYAVNLFASGIVRTIVLVH